MKKYIKQALTWLDGFLQFVFWHMPISVLALVGFYFSFNFILYPSTATISIANYTFAVVATFSALSFTYCSCVDGKEKTVSRYCGERFLHSAISLIVAAVLQHFLFQDNIKSLGDSPTMLIALNLIGFFPGLLYLGSLINCIAALRELNTILFHKKKPGEELMKFF